MWTPSILEQPKPKSPEAVVDLLRGYLNAAFEKEISFLEINAVIDGKIQSISISTGLK